MEERKSRLSSMVWRDFDHTYASDLYPKIRCFQIFVMYLKICEKIRIFVNYCSNDSSI